MDIKSTFLMWLCKNGKIAEYGEEIDGMHFIKEDGFLLPRIVFASHDRLSDTREEAIIRAMDELEEEGCALYLELYPAPEKGEYAFIAQDAAGDWYGFNSKPNAYKHRWDSTDYIHPKFIQSSPPNPFWRKTLR